MRGQSRFLLGNMCIKINLVRVVLMKFLVLREKLKAYAWNFFYKKIIFEIKKNIKYNAKLWIPKCEFFVHFFFKYKPL